DSSRSWSGQYKIWAAAAACEPAPAEARTGSHAIHPTTTRGPETEDRRQRTEDRGQYRVPRKQHGSGPLAETETAPLCLLSSVLLTRQRHLGGLAGDVVDGELGLLGDPAAGVQFLQHLLGQHGLLGGAPAHDLALLLDLLGHPLRLGLV